MVVVVPESSWYYLHVMGLQYHDRSIVVDVVGFDNHNTHRRNRCGNTTDVGARDSPWD